MNLPVVSGLEVIKRLKKIGFLVIRQKGSHIRLEKFNGKKTLKITVPLHKELKKGTLNIILKESELTVEEFEKLK